MDCLSPLVLLRAPAGEKKEAHCEEVREEGDE